MEEMKIRTKFGIVVQIICILFLVGTLVLLLINWNQMSAEIPGHYNGAGEVDSMTGKGSLLILYMVNWIMFLGVTEVECFPQVWNVGVRVTALNREKVYRIVYHMIVTAKLAMVLIFSFLTVWPVFGENLPFWFTPVSLTATFAPMVFFSIQLWRAR